MSKQTQVTSKKRFVISKGLIGKGTYSFATSEKLSSVSTVSATGESIPRRKMQVRPRCGLYPFQGKI